MKDIVGWQLRWKSFYMEDVVERVVINVKVLNFENFNKMVVVVMGNMIQFWSVVDDGISREIGKSLEI